MPKSGSSRPSSPPELWGLRRTLMVAVPLTVLGLLIVYAYLPHDTSVKLSKVKGGECIVLPDTSVVRNLQKRECSKEHDGEIYAKFSYPGSTVPGQPSPEENCALTEGFSPDEAAYWSKVIDLLQNSGKELLLLSNNADQTQDRDYACVIKVPGQTSRYLDQVSAAAGPVPTSPPTTKG